MPKRLFASIFILMLLPSLNGCGSGEQSGPPSTDTRSTTIPELADRIDFLQTYVSFDRQYEQLEFNINFKNNSGGFVPGPSDWDIQLVAKVPPHEIPLWTEGLKPSSEEEGLWLSWLAPEIDVSGVDIWYRTSGKVIGVDQKNSIIAYRLSTLGL